MTSLSRRSFNASALRLAAGVAGSAVASRAAVARADQTSTARGGSAADVSQLTLADASSRIRAGTVTSVELVNACLARIDIYQ
jgi:hypothetical protein